jgi:transposase
MFEALAMALCQAMPVVEVAEILREHDTRLWRVVAHYVEKAQAAKSWKDVKRILVDETSSRRGHNYVTNVVDAETRELLFMSEGRSSESLEAFAEALPAHGGEPEQITLIGMDMSPAYQKGAKHFPKARIVFDHFHLMQLAGQAVDGVRKQLKREGADLSQGLWAIRGNENTRTEEQKQRRTELMVQYPKIGRALALRDCFQEALLQEDSQALKDWVGWAQRSRLEPFQKMAKTVKEHWNGIVAFIETRVTNGVIEAINGLLQLAKRLARGFRSFKTFQLMGYLKAGKLKLTLPQLAPT